MRGIEHILWYIESALDSDLDLSGVARHFGLSPFALSRQFVATTGWPVMRYVRARRLSRAALALREGHPDILDVALAAGYGSHEAFTRAFCDLFGVAPSQVRGQAHDPIKLVEPLRMKALNFVPLSEPRFEHRPEFIVAGLGERFTFERNEGIVGLWQAFDPYVGRVPGQVGDFTYGLCCNPGEDGSFEYIAGVEVARTAELAANFRFFRLAARDYAVFRHLGHVSMIHQTVFTVFNQWLPASGYQAADAPEFELYSPDFDPMRGVGYVDLWIPLAGR
ncbi:AraC family transcriptional regulator [Pseudomonas entomophila]|uniref:AraC family transcriptional regulator n=1 Tax=Pseudomonas entomophila TaxID=312306 RepID=UPI001BD0B717|nr:AraC family transcriptional regulator [Pseudomonas entomophila]QVM93535.1 AraC family transcriptional regulator [Pseudomonas entomophila]